MGSLASEPPEHQQKISGLLIKRGFNNYHLIAPGDLPSKSIWYYMEWRHLNLYHVWATPGPKSHLHRPARRSRTVFGKWIIDEPSSSSNLRKTISEPQTGVRNRFSGARVWWTFHLSFDTFKLPQFQHISQYLENVRSFQNCHLILFNNLLTSFGRWVRAKVREGPAAQNDCPRLPYVNQLTRRGRKNYSFAIVTQSSEHSIRFLGTWVLFSTKSLCFHEKSWFLQRTCTSLLRLAIISSSACHANARDCSTGHYLIRILSYSYSTDYTDLTTSTLTQVKWLLLDYRGSKR